VVLKIGGGSTKQRRIVVKGSITLSQARPSVSMCVPRRISQQGTYCPDFEGSNLGCGNHLRTHSLEKDHKKKPPRGVSPFNTIQPRSKKIG